MFEKKVGKIQRKSIKTSVEFKRNTSILGRNLNIWRKSNVNLTEVTFP